MDTSRLPTTLVRQAKALASTLCLLALAALVAGATVAPARAAPPRGPKIQAPGGVFVNSTTLGATIEIDGKVVGKVPMDESIVLMPGEHTVKLTLRGYTVYQDKVTIVAGEEVELEIDLIPYAGIVRINTKEPGATVKVDGKVEGVTPFDGDVTVGKKTITVSRPGFVDEVRALEVMAGEAYNLDIELRAITKPKVVDESEAFYETWWFWTIVGVAGAGAVTAIAVTSGGEAAPPTPNFTFTIQ